ncbi:MAG: hypothetical protein WD894_12660 [Pirellulales bacterium]
MAGNPKRVLIAVAIALSLLSNNGQAAVIFFNRDALGVVDGTVDFTNSETGGVRRFFDVKTPDTSGAMQGSAAGSFGGASGQGRHRSTTTFSGGIFSASGSGSASADADNPPAGGEDDNRRNQSLFLSGYQLDFQVIETPAPYSLIAKFSKSATIFIDREGNFASTFGTLKAILQGENHGQIHLLDHGLDGPDAGSVSGNGMLQPDFYRLNVQVHASSGSAFTPSNVFEGGPANARYNFSFSVGEPSPEIRWLNPANGFFQVAENWSPQEVPAAEHIAVFDLADTYAVELEQDVTNEGLRANGAGVNVTFDLAGHRYTANRFNGGGLPDDDVSITFKGGGGPVVSGDGKPRATANGEVRFQELFDVEPGLRWAYVEGVQAVHVAGTIDGSLTIKDPTTTANFTTAMTVGADEAGLVVVENGAALHSGAAFLGLDRVLPVLGGGDGTVIVSGQNSKWELTTGLGLVIGSGGKGSVTALNGGAVDASQSLVTLADEPFSTGALHVTGAGSTFEAQTLVVGENGEGSMLVEQGGGAEAVSITVGGSASSSTSTGKGTVAIFDQGSSLMVDRLRIGEVGEGTVVVSDRGFLLGGSRLDTSIGKKGKLVVQSDGLATFTLLQQSGGELVVADGGGLHTRSALVLGDGGSEGTATVSGRAGPDSASWTVDDTLTIEAGGIVTVADGGALRVLDRLEVGAGGLLRRSGDGLVEIGNVVASPGTVTVGSGGTLTGGGTLTLGGGVLVVSGTGQVSIAQVLPGDSPGTLTIEGDYRQEQFSLLGIEIAGTAAGQFDVLKVTGNATIGGQLSLEFLDGFAPRQGDAFEFLDVSGTLDGQFANVELRNLAPEFQFDLRPDAGGLTMVALNDGVFVPPPPSVWNVDANGNWSSGVNWTVDVPDNAGAIAVFGNKIAAPRVVTADEPINVGRIDFDSAHAYTIAGSEAVTLNTRSFTEQINVVNGSHTISAPVTLADNTTISVSPAANNLSVTGALSANGVTLTKAGAGTLTLNNLRAAGLSIDAGTVAIATNGTSDGTSVLGALSIAGGAAPMAKLDLNNNAAIIDYTGGSPVASVRSQVLSGRGGPGLGATWTGQGITSSTAAAANAADAESRSVGYAENSALPLGPYSSFRGQPVDDTAVLMAYTRTGDANLDGVVNDDDVTIVSATYAPGVSQPHWALGDFDYNGFVDDDDVTLLGVFYDPSAPPLVTLVPEAGSGVAAVPEPSVFALMIVATFIGATALAMRCHARK